LIFLASAGLGAFVSVVVLKIPSLACKLDRTWAFDLLLLPLRVEAVLRVSTEDELLGVVMVESEDTSAMFEKVYFFSFCLFIFYAIRLMFMKKNCERKRKRTTYPTYLHH
jgi:hypothetical protein